MNGASFREPAKSPGNVVQDSAVVQGALGVFSLRSAAGVERTLAAFVAVIERNGGEWDAASGEVTLPLVAGLRHGVARGHARAVPKITGSELVVETRETGWALDRSSVFLLVMGAGAGLVSVLWPFFPAVARFVPVGLVVGASVWLAVLSRLRHLGVGELLAQVESELEEE